MNATEYLVAGMALLPMVAHAQPGAPQQIDGSISGVVLRANGGPAVAVRVWVTRSSGDGEILRETRTDGEGLFVLAKIPVAAPSDSFRAHSAAEHTVTASEWVSLSARRPRAQASLRLWDAATLRCTVRDRDGAPVHGVHVSAAYDVSRLFAFEPQTEAVTGEDGSVELRGVPLGLVSVYAWTPGHAMATEAVLLKDNMDMALELPGPGGVELDVTVTGVPEGRTATVSVIPYQQGSAAAFPRVTRRGEVGPEGRWRVAGLPDCEYLVRAYLDGFHADPHQARIEPNDPHALAFRLEAIATTKLSGRLVDLEGRPLAGESLVFRHYSGGQRVNATTDAEGRFDASCPLAPGTEVIAYLVDSDFAMAQEKTADHIGSHDARFLDDHEFVAAEAQVLELRAARAASIAGRVVDGKGRGVRYRSVELQQSRPNRSPLWMGVKWTTTDEDGYYAFRGLLASLGEVRVAADGQGSCASEPIAIEAGEAVRDVVVTMEPPCEVRGRVVDAKGVPVPGARVWLRNWDFENDRQSDGSVTEVLTDREGRYGFVDVGPGGHYFQVLLGDRRDLVRTEPEKLEPGQRRTIDFEVEL